MTETPYPTASYMKINGGTIARTVEFSDGVMVDLDSEGAIVGIEVIGSMPMSLVAWHIIRELRLPANPPQPTAENAPYTTEET